MILIDEREGSIQLLPVEEGGLGYLPHAERARLDDSEGKPIGDAIVVANGPDDSTFTIGVEIKSVMDAVSSLASGRLKDQLARMLKKETSGLDAVFLLIYGDYICGPNGNLHRYHEERNRFIPVKFGSRPIPWSFLESFLLTASIKSGVMVERVGGIEQAARWLRVVEKWGEKDWDKHRGMVNIQFRESVAAPEMNETEEAIFRTVSAQRCGIGMDRAMKAAKHFFSVQDMVMATEEDWVQIEGIGPVIARAIVKTFSRDKFK